MPRPATSFGLHGWSLVGPYISTGFHNAVKNGHFVKFGSQRQQKVDKSDHFQFIEKYFMKLQRLIFIDLVISFQ